jgi:photoactive yellow protein
VCAFCRIDLPKNYPSNGNEQPNLSKIDFALCSSCDSSANIIKHDDLTEINRDLVDELPYGLIILNSDNNIILYNKTESELTGLGISEIEGKNFFKDVAPCTAVKEFQGEVDKMRLRGEDLQTSIRFTFNHRNFFALVDVLATYLRIPDVVVLSIQKLE